MRRERREFFPDQAEKGSLLSILEAETGLLWMWAGLSCFLSSGDGYVGDLLELPQLEKIQEVLPSRRDESHFR